MKRVLGRKHIVDGAQLEVTEHIQLAVQYTRPVYDHKVLVKGINPDTTADGLENFLEAKSRVEVSHIIYGKTEGVVLVTFEKPPGLYIIKSCVFSICINNLVLQ